MRRLGAPHEAKHDVHQASVEKNASKTVSAEKKAASVKDLYVEQSELAATRAQKDSTTNPIRKMMLINFDAPNNTLTIRMRTGDDPRMQERIGKRDLVSLRAYATAPADTGRGWWGTIKDFASGLVSRGLAGPTPRFLPIEIPGENGPSQTVYVDHRDIANMEARDDIRDLAYPTYLTENFRISTTDTPTHNCDYLLHYAYRRFDQSWSGGIALSEKHFSGEQEIKSFKALHSTWATPPSEEIQKQADALLSQLRKKQQQEEGMKNWKTVQKRRMEYFEATTDGNSVERARRNWQNTQTWIRVRAAERERLSGEGVIALVKKIHTDLLSGIVWGGGSFRTQELRAEGAGSYMHPAAAEREMEDFAGWFAHTARLADEGRYNPIVFAAQAFQRMATIQPFVDGNHRTSTMLTDYIMQRYELLPALYEGQKMASYPFKSGGTRDMRSTDVGVENFMQGLRTTYGI